MSDYVEQAANPGPAFAEQTVNGARFGVAVFGVDKFAVSSSVDIGPAYQEQS